MVAQAAEVELVPSTKHAEWLAAALVKPLPEICTDAPPAKERGTVQAVEDEPLVQTPLSAAAVFAVKTKFSRSGFSKIC